jgi:DNA-binding response OmpR family regulator
MAPPIDAGRVRVALIDEDSGLLTMLDRRFNSLHWEREALTYAPGPDQLAAMRLHALVVNPALTGLDYVERIALALPGLAMLVCSDPAPVADRVRALRGGADDWVSKPCHPEELIARIQAVMRRRRAGELPVDAEPIVAGELAVRPDRFDAYVGEEPAGLSRKEYELLYQLASVGGGVLEREEIYQRVWGYLMVRGDRSVDVFVRKLRSKLERVSPGWRYVHTHFGVGYRFAAEALGGEGAAGAGATAQPAVGESGAGEAVDRVAGDPGAGAAVERVAGDPGGCAAVAPAAGERPELVSTLTSSTS